jgi:hypothetical protein
VKYESGVQTRGQKWDGVPHLSTTAMRVPSDENEASSTEHAYNMS